MSKKEAYPIGPDAALDDQGTRVEGRLILQDILTSYNEEIAAQQSRIDTVKRVIAHLEEKGDPRNMLPPCRVVLKTYERHLADLVKGRDEDMTSWALFFGGGGTNA